MLVLGVVLVVAVLVGSLAYYLDRQAVNYMTGQRRLPGQDWWGGSVDSQGVTPGYVSLGKSRRVQGKPGFELLSPLHSARDAGLRPGDKVLTVGGREYTSNREMVADLIRSRTAGEVVTTEVEREGAPLELELTLQPYYRNPGDLGLPYTDVEVQSDSGYLLRGWFIRPPQWSDGRTGVFVHGAKSSRFQALHGARHWYERGYGLLAMDLSGRGSSEGRYITYSVNERVDVVSILQWLRGREEVARDKLVVFGTSNGASTAIYAAATDTTARALALDAPYANLWRVATEELETRGIPTWLLYPMRFAVQLRMSIDLASVKPEEVVDKISTPMFFVHGDADTQVFLYHSEQMVAARRAAGLPTEFWVLPDAEHGFDNYPPPNVFWGRVFDFFDSVVGPLDRQPTTAGEPG